MNTLDDALHAAYAEGRKDEAEASSELLSVARDIYTEVAGKAPPKDPNSYLPPALVERLAMAIGIVEKEPA